MVVGTDVGSTTVKSVAVDPASREIVWSRYERHEGRQADKIREQLMALEDAFPTLPRQQIRIFVTGSGAAPLRAPLGAKFVQEVNAVTMAVEALHADAGSVIELGGQDAKIIIFKEHRETGEKRVIASMNDKCASGTGATLDKCILKIGVDPRQVGRLAWDGARLHPVAAKCGVFAETDIRQPGQVGNPCGRDPLLARRRHRDAEPVGAREGQHAAAQGPSARWAQHLPAVPAGVLAAEDSRALEVEGPLTSPRARGRGARFSYLATPSCTRPTAPPSTACTSRRPAVATGVWRGSRSSSPEPARPDSRLPAGPPLARTRGERDAFVAKYRIPPFRPPDPAPGSKVRGYIGLDGGSTSSKAVLVDDDGRILAKRYQLSKGNPIRDTQEILAGIDAEVRGRGARLEVLGFGATGYAADVLQESLAADVKVVETVAHMMAALRYFDAPDVICDVGGQDIKVLFMVDGEIRDFRLSNQCSAGNGMLLQAMADQFGIPIADYADQRLRGRAQSRSSATAAPSSSTATG